MAEEWAKLSHCKRRQVGAIIVKNRMIISDGYNGTPTGFERNLLIHKYTYDSFSLYTSSNFFLKSVTFFGVVNILPVGLVIKKQL